MLWCGGLGRETDKREREGKSGSGGRMRGKEEEKGKSERGRVEVGGWRIFVEKWGKNKEEKRKRNKKKRKGRTCSD